MLIVPVRDIICNYKLENVNVEKTEVYPVRVHWGSLSQFLAGTKIGQSSL